MKKKKEALSEKTDEEINKLLEDIPEEEWYKHEGLIREGIQRYIKLFIKK